MTRRLAALGFAIALAAGPLSTATSARPPDLPPPPPLPAPQPSPEPASPQLTALLDRVREAPATRAGGRVGVAVVGASGERLTAAAANSPLLPASTIKLITAATALRLLGPDFRFITRVYATAPPDRNGVVGRRSRDGRRR